MNMLTSEERLIIMQLLIDILKNMNVDRLTSDCAIDIIHTLSCLVHKREMYAPPDIIELIEDVVWEELKREKCANKDKYYIRQLKNIFAKIES